MSEIQHAQLLHEGDLVVTGRLVDASNATLFGRIENQGNEIPVIYKPVAGERPLWDFATGSLARRERAAFLISEVGGFKLVPATILRDGPFGIGAVQRWIEIAEGVDVIAFGRSDNSSVRAMALFDAIINNTDRKFGHILISEDKAVFGCDHGVTFHTDDKLRTVIWQFAGLALTHSELDQLGTLLPWLANPESEIAELLSEDEIRATRQRVERLIREAVFPFPSAQWPAVPWPPV